MTNRLLPALLVCAASATVHAQEDPPDLSDVYPTYIEREILFVTNEVRSEPAAWPTPMDARPPKMDWECKAHEPKSLPPVEFNRDLAEAARFHADDMFEHRPFFEHESSDGTSFAARLSRFYQGGGAGENIAKGQAGAIGALEGWMMSPGHRCNILSADWNELGTGYASQQNGSEPHYVQDFGARPGVTRRRLPSGIAQMRGNDRFRFAVSYYDPSEAGPAVIQLIRESGCTDLTLAAGVAHQGTYAWTGPNDDFPETYWFVAIDAEDEIATYPEEGALYTPVPHHLDDRRAERPIPGCIEGLLPEPPTEDDPPGGGGDTGGGGGGGGGRRRDQGCASGGTAASGWLLGLVRR